MTGMHDKSRVVGQMFRARDGGLHTPFDRAGLDRLTAQADDGGGLFEVRGVAVRFGVVGQFWMGALRLEPGSIVEAPKKNYRYRDVMGLYSHDSSAVLARVGANTMDVQYAENEITYSMRLNQADSLARDVMARLRRGDLNSASIGFVVVEGDWVEAVDNGFDPDPDTAGQKVDVFAVTKAELVEISIVGQGAFAGATSQPAEHTPVGQLAMNIVATDDDTDVIVGADGTEPATTEPEGPPSDIAESGQGDESDSREEAAGGPEPDVTDQSLSGTEGAGQVGSADWITSQLAEMRKRRIDPRIEEGG